MLRLPGAASAPSPTHLPPTMPVTTRSKITSFALKALTGAIASAVLVSSVASAAGLGKLTVLSSLGQPLRAEIELSSVSAEEAPGLTVKLAPADAFRLANIEFNPALLTLRFTVEQRNGRQYIKISSTQPVNEPFVDMLLELSWSSGRLVREYTFLLDPAELRATQPAQASSPIDVLSQGNRTTPAAAAQYRPAAKPATAPAAAQEAPEPKARPEPKQAASSTAANAAGDYKVKKGDTLGRIAAQLKPVDISLDMMLVALYRANPEAFAGNNMNRLKSGTILTVPDADTVRGTGQGEAHGVVVAHAADFTAYRNKLAGQVATAEPTKAAEAGQSAGGKITAKVEERATAASEAKDQLKLSKAEAAAKNGAVSAEDKIAKDKALAEATSRVKELEKNVSDLEKLMTVKAKPVDAPKVVEAAKPAEAPKVADAAKPAEAAVPPPIKTAPATPPPIKTAAPKKPVAPAEPGIIDMLMDNLTVIGGVLAVLLLGAFAVMRRKKAAPSEPSIMGAPTDQAHSMFAETGGASVDTNNSVFNSSFAPSASQLDTNEVDPVAEADVYIAYGRDAQAEEILKEALRSHPERMPVRLKLLEIYATRKDTRAFEGQSTEMYGMTKGQGDDWAQAAALGLSIDPQNPLYASAATAAPVIPVPSAADTAQQALLAEQLDDALAAEASMDMDLGFSNDATALPDLDATLVAPAPTAAPKPVDDQSLDFDLGGLSFEPMTAEPVSAPAASAATLANSVPDMEFTSTAPAAASAAETKVAEEESLDLAFDMAFDTPAAPAAPVKPTALDDISLDFTGKLPGDDVDGAALANAFDLPATPATPAAADDPFSNPLMDLDAMDFDLPAAAPTAAAPGSKPEDMGFDVPDLPSLPASADPVASHTPAAPHFDMSGIDLDLPEIEASDVALPDFATELPGDVADAGEMSAVHMEMETKLDLAIAYQEIGDKEGARELLDEVIKGGNTEQVGKANTMRSKLS
jgi:pilus assembly protein FimV